MCLKRIFLSLCFFVLGSTVLAAGEIDVIVHNLLWNGHSKVINAFSVSNLRDQIAGYRVQPVNGIVLALRNGTLLANDEASWGLILEAIPHEVFITHPAPNVPPPPPPPVLRRH